MSFRKRICRECGDPHVHDVPQQPTQPVIRRGLEVAQQLWSTVHGATTLELAGLVLTPDPGATYDALLDTLLRGPRT